MIIYNRKTFRIITTHIKEKKVSKLLSKKLILNKLITIKFLLKN